MPEGYDAAVEMALTELMERAHREQLGTDQDYEVQTRKQTDNAEMIESIYSKLSEQDRRTLEKFYEQQDSLTWKRMRFLYIQGAKDLAQLLRELGIV